VINGGVKDQGDGLYDCIGTGMGGKGTRYPLCAMTPDQINNWGKALLPYGCMMLLWRFDKTYFSKTTNQTAFKALATLAASKPKRACTKPT
jgi:hypothetical protein